MPIPNRCLIVLIALASSGHMANAQGPGPFKGNRGIGTWETTNTGKLNPFEDKRETKTQTVITREVVDGWYLETTTKDGDRIVSIALTTGDAKLGELRNWTFVTGNVVTATGTWDEKTQTMTFTGKDQYGNSIESVTKWPDDDHNEGSVVLKNPAGVAIIDFKSKSHRIKEAK